MLHAHINIINLLQMSSIISEKYILKIKYVLYIIFQLYDENYVVI